MDRIIIEHDLKMAFDDGYQAGLEAAAPKWISVEERLPEKMYSACLVYSDGYIQVACWSHDKMGWDVWFYVDGEYDPDVTHWMPLPEPPKEGLR